MEKTLTRLAVYMNLEIARCPQIVLQQPLYTGRIHHICCICSCILTALAAVAKRCIVGTPLADETSAGVVGVIGSAEHLEAVYCPVRIRESSLHERAQSLSQSCSRREN